MSEKRFTLTDWHEVKDNGKIMTVDEVVGKLNEQQATINEYKENWDDMVELATKTSLRNIQLDEQIGQLKAKLREKEEDERLYANEIVKLNKEAKEVLDFKSLGGDY